MSETSNMSDLELRHLQLNEIRIIIGLEKDSTHESVIKKLIGFQLAQLLERIPERYRHMYCVCSEVK